MMPAPVDLEPKFSVAELRSLVAQTRDRAFARRLRAISLIAEGHSRVEVAQRIGIGAAALRQWVHRYNRGGPEALKHAQTSGRPTKLTLEQRDELQRVISTSLDQRMWRLVDIVEEISRRFDVCYDLASVGRLVRSMGYHYVDGRWCKRREDAKPLRKELYARRAELLGAEN